MRPKTEPAPAFFRNNQIYILSVQETSKGSANRNEPTPLHVYFAGRATYVSVNVQTLTDFSPLEKTQCLFVDQL